MRADWNRLAPLTGLVFFGVFAAAIVAGGNTPNSDWSAQRVVAYYVKHHGGQRFTAFALAYVALVALLFATVLRSWLRSRSKADDGLIALGFAGAIVYTVGLALASTVNFSLVDKPTKITPAAEQALSVLSNDDFIPLFVGLVALAIGFGIAIARSGALPRWLGWASIVIGVLAAIPNIDWIAFVFAYPIWVLVVSIVMLIRGEKSLPSAAAGAAQGA